MGAGARTLGRAGAVSNLSIQIRYCTATTADKPFSKMQNFIGQPGFRAPGQCGKSAGTVPGSLRCRGSQRGRLQLGGQSRRDPSLQQRAVRHVLGVQHLAVGVGARHQVTAAVRHDYPDLGVEAR